ncbi:galectin-2 isoform X2 [Phascolarctos cinereus]|uniref:Galectin n=1 Tax=Phascolarctos cinereus TaxID=38626 RepID=A0A6P5JZ98_PHACI|nr:galectin-2-like isoform X2 [Phascolarctos cinereus]
MGGVFHVHFRLRNKMELYHMELKKGMMLKLKGKINDDASWFAINLGSGPQDLALHFNPRFEENIIVCNSQNGGSWEKEHRDGHVCFKPGTEIKLTVTFEEDEFQVKLPDGHQVKFPNRRGQGHLPYCCVKGGISLTSFKVE